MPKLVSQARLKELFYYDPDTGVFRNRGDRGRARKGSVAGTVNRDGYVQIGVDYVHHYAHRLAWIYMTGDEPLHEIDHINGQPDDNRFANLRPATTQQNMYNLGLTKSNRSGYRGVSWHASSNAWRARMRVGGKETHIGLYTSKEEAAAAYEIEAARLRGAFHRALSKPFL